MPIKDNREYRNFNNFELRAAEDAEEIAGGGVVEGYASTFEEYDLLSFDTGNGSREIWREQIAPDAFNNADMSDVVFLRDHQGQVYARTKNNLIAIMPDERGLYTRTDLTKTTGAREMYEDIKAGNYSQMSFAFRVASNGETWETIREGNDVIYKRNITAIEKVFDISAVAFPANPTTDIAPATRAAFDGAIEGLRAERLEAERKAKDRAREMLKLKIKIMEGSKS